MKKTSARCLCSFVLLATAALADEMAEARFRGAGNADPIRIENVRRADGPVAGQSTITFDLAWDHSWRAAWKVGKDQHGGEGTLKLENWDAAWVFVKFRQGSEGMWRHAMLVTNRADHLVPAEATLDVGMSDAPSTGLGAGVFVYRKKQGSGPNQFKDVTLRWQHPQSVFDPAQAEVRVIAIQMVRVPECAFWAGDGSTNSVTGQFSSGPTVHPFHITSEQPLTLGGDTGEALVCRDVGARNPLNVDDFHLDVTQTLPAAFPKGYRAFYCMRHEITQQQYADFLNMLPYAMQSARSRLEVSAPPGTPGVRAKGDLGSGRIGIKIVVSGVANASSPVVISRETFVASGTRESPGTPAVYAADEPHVACNYISHIDGSHYAAWAGLRPMTELEFEKACRGPLKPVPNEFAWGTAEIAGHSASNGAYRVRNVGKPDEAAAWEGDGGPDATHGNAALAAFRMEADPDLKGSGPLRAGIFATPTSDRVSAGASYWGILDLSGNVMERCITIGTAAGRDFTGTHGNGTAFSWKETGFCVRGGGCTHGGKAAMLAGPHRVSDRSYGVNPFHDARKAAQGFRCARTAP